LNTQFLDENLGDLLFTLLVKTKKENSLKNKFKKEFIKGGNRIIIGKNLFELIKIFSLNQSKPKKFTKRGDFIEIIE